MAAIRKPCIRLITGDAPLHTWLFNEMNRHLRTVIVAPMTTTERPYPTQVTATFQAKRGQIVLDQVRTVDQERLVKRLGNISIGTARKVSTVLVEMFTRK